MDLFSQYDYIIERIDELKLEMEYNLDELLQEQLECLERYADILSKRIYKIK